MTTTTNEQVTASAEFWHGTGQLVTCQEVGHTFGLEHQDTNFTNPNLGTCMDYTSDPDGPPSNLHPNKHDYDELVAIYSHLDSFSTVGAPSRAALTPGDSPAAWGTRVAGSATRGLATYVRDFGHGTMALTFVFWA